VKPRSTHRRPGRAGRLRPRLIATFAVVAALTAVTVAGASYLVVRELRLRGETDTAVEQARFNVELAQATLPPEPTTTEIEEVVRALQRRGGFDTVAIAGDRVAQSSISLDAGAVPADLRDLAAAGRLTSARRTVANRSFVIVGGPVGTEGLELWFFFPLDEVFDDLDSLGRVLAASAAIAVVLSGLAGVVAAGRLLRPIGRARDAARTMAAGDLSTRLPVAGSDELTELSRSFNDMAAALETTVADLRTADAGHRRFVADVSHELRTPVTALAAAADALEPSVEQLPERERRAARLLVTESQRLRDLVGDLMEISRLDAGAAPLEPEHVDLGRLVGGAIAAHGWADVVRARGVEGLTVTADRRRLDRVITNLVDNALRHGAPPVEVTARVDGTTAVIAVRDHGPGIPAEHLAHVFDRFYKGDPARGRSSSSGLGLAIALENARLHGGEITAADHPEGGACFTVVLPGAVAEPLPDGEWPVTGPPHHEGDPPPSHQGPLR
jgi:two-component system, OmpR family, sensor histidine kinase MtrB